MTGPGRPAAGLVLLLALAACRDTGPDGPAAASVRDSAGVSIMDHGRVDAAALPRLQLAERPIVRIGVTDGEEAYQFTRITDATLRADGSIAVLDASRTLRIFDRTGTLRWTTGRDGDGPGEFRAPLRVEAVAAAGTGPDTLLVWDVRHGRFSRFVEPVGLVGEAPLPALAGRAAWLGPLDGGAALFEQRTPERTTEGGRAAIATRVTLLRVDADRSTMTALGTEPQVLQYQEGNDPDGAFSPAIFAEPVRFAPAGDGYWVGDPAETQLRRVGVDGERRIVRWRGDQRAVTSADVDAVVAGWMAEAPTPALRDAIARYAATHPRAARFPAFDTLLVAADGGLWLRDAVREHEDDGVRRWTRLAPDGRAFTARLEHPAALRLLRIREDEVLAVERDELEVERLVRYRIAPASRAP
jgi:hypothetical protein